MKKLVPFVAGGLLGVAVCVTLPHCALHAPSVVKSAEAQGKHYVCPACGSSCDDVVHDHPGTCPVCGMTLVEEGAMGPEPAGKPVAILLFDGAEIIDFSGPYEVFGAAGFDVYTVARTKAPVTTSMGMTVVPKYSFADAPQPAVLVVPGGGVAEVRKNAETLTWVRDVSGRADQTMSVCNGAFILGSAGLLDGLGATTTFHLLSTLGTEFPKTRVMRDQRYVDNGKILTTAGLSAGIDGALHVVEKRLGVGAAQSAALGIEYDWHPEGGYVRAALADHLIPDIDLDDLGSWAITSTDGTTERWEVVARGTSNASAADLLARVDRALTTHGWAHASTASAPSAEYRFEDERHRPWKGSLVLQRRAETHDYALTLKIATLAP
jgi:putative intracellular protease/amidase